MPFLFAWHTKRALKWMIPGDDLGIEFIRLDTNHPADKGRDKKPAYLKGFTRNGQYLKRSAQYPTHIDLYSSDICMGIPWPLRLTTVMTLRIANTLAHEVGHHLVATRGYIFSPHERYRGMLYDPIEERLAEKYAENVLGRMKRSFKYRAAARVMRFVADRYHDLAILAWNAGNYKKAAYFWFCASNPYGDDVSSSAGWNMAMKKMGLEPERPWISRNSEMKLR